MYKADLVRLVTLSKTEGFKVLRARMEVDIDKSIRSCIDKDSTQTLEDIRYHQGRVDALRRVLNWVDSAQGELARKTGDKET